MTPLTRFCRGSQHETLSHLATFAREVASNLHKEKVQQPRGSCDEALRRQREHGGRVKAEPFQERQMLLSFKSYMETLAKEGHGVTSKVKGKWL